MKLGSTKQSVDQVCRNHDKGWMWADWAQKILNKKDLNYSQKSKVTIYCLIFFNRIYSTTFYIYFIFESTKLISF